MIFYQINGLDGVKIACTKKRDTARGRIPFLKSVKDRFENLSLLGLITKTLLMTICLHALFALMFCDFRLTTFF